PATLSRLSPSCAARVRSVMSWAWPNATRRLRTQPVERVNSRTSTSRNEAATKTHLRTATFSPVDGPVSERESNENEEPAHRWRRGWQQAARCYGRVFFRRWGGCLSPHIAGARC